MNKIKIGNQTNCNVSPFLTFDFAVKNDFDAFEWFSDPGMAGWNESSFSPEQIDQIRVTGKQKNIRFSVHAPWRADPLTDEGQQLILRSIDFAEKIGAKLVNTHIFPEYKSEFFAEKLQALLTAAKEKNLSLSLENVAECSPENVNRLFDCLGKFRETYDCAGFCLDIGHANIYRETRHNYGQFLDRIDEAVELIHLHAHENHGHIDEHLPLFSLSKEQNEEPVKNLLRFLKKRNFKGSIIMEQWPDPPETLAKVRNHLIELWHAG
jgi:sugar phosphate isomerase/epimerase